MHKVDIKPLVDAGQSTREIAEALSCSQTNVRHWLKKFNLQTHENRRRSLGHVEVHLCTVCGRPASSRRKLCSGCYTKIRRYRTKEAAIALLGGKCRDCGWSGNQVGFTFHHVAGKKEFVIAKVANKAWSVVKRELKKCILLCIRCHSIRHANNEGAKFLDALKTYRGRSLD